MKKKNNKFLHIILSYFLSKKNLDPNPHLASNNPNASTRRPIYVNNNNNNKSGNICIRISDFLLNINPI